MVLLPAMASAVSGTPGAGGSGSDGVRGGAGGEGGGAMINADASLSIGAGTEYEGGAGGQGHALDGYYDAADTAVFGLDGAASLAGQRGIAAGDSFSITIGGVTKTITISATDTLPDIANKINGAFAGGRISAYATNRGGSDYLSITQTAYLYNIEMNDVTNTPLAALGLDRVLARPFDHGGHGGAGGDGLVRQGADRVTDNAGELYGGQADDAMLSNGFAGTGAFRKTGTGWLTLGGDGTAFTGATRIGQGGLAVNGDWRSSAMTVADGATLGGSGRVGATEVEAGGTLAAGNSIGTLAVDGDLTLNSGATLAVEVDPSGGDGDRVEVTGQASLAGSVVHVGADGGYRPLSQYTFLHADGGIVGQFDDVSSDFAFLDPSLVYDSHDVSLLLARNNVRFASLAETDNQRALAAYAETLPTGEAAQQYLLQLSGARVAAAFAALGGDSLLAGPTVAVALQRQFADALRQRGGALDGGSRATLNERLQRGLQALAAPGSGGERAVTPTGLTPNRAAADGGDEHGGVWVQARSSRYQEDSDFPTGNAAYTFRGEQLAVGLDGRRGAWLLGAAVGRGQGEFHYDNRDADGDLKAWFAGLYGRWQGNDGLYARGDLNYGRARVDHTRTIGAGVLAESDSDLRSLRVDLEAGVDLIQGDLVLRPYGRLAWTRLERDAFTETGAGALGLAVDDTTLGVGEAAVGVDGARYFQLGRRRLSLHAGLALERGFGDARAEQDAAFVGAGGAFRVAGAERDRLQLAPHLGVGLAVNPALSLWAGYQGRLGGEHHSQGALISGRLTW
ncbi:autotransporter outer membrane beta-barrel domain-containing protein [Alloalcanivorax marinus]|uniref:autotransporter family protein n=1 Tax=Alloalcanivorax marinus TaxID=1177169 RepID=UPI001933D8E6|nr:autotransporter outer membrane beta-barrel domain-containing protein [Alloalcanivorax marinus]MBL7250477.1 autotransporter domain-containing protein [Alloalcanivorax marinus]